MLRSISIFIAIILSSTGLIGQVLEGKVVDQYGTPVPDAYVIKYSSTEHTHTNELGLFRLDGLQAGDTINVSFVGFKTRQVILQEQDFAQHLTVEMDETPINLEQVVISKKISTLNQISTLDLENNPVNSAQEVLRKVPGLFIAQHAGGGKAEQIFLRGFDIDHGTDIGISVDGMPVNMVSHAHGQGYADLHFLIPETIENIDFGKGPYYASRGNFTTAGYVEFQTKEKLDNSLASLEYGQFNTLRAVGLFDLLGGNPGQNAYLATEYLLSDGPFESAQNFNRVNVLGKYTADLPNNGKLSFLASHFTSKWDASGQVPQRAIDAGLIGRFGAIDDTEGGATSRTNVALHHTKMISSNAFVKSRAYFTQYDFELYSNFTFFLNNPENGDQIRQVENRNIFGIESVLHRQYRLSGANLNLQAGAGLRYDQVKDNELSRTLNRKTTLEPIALGDINESNIYSFAEAELDLGKVLINPGLRVDYFKFDYVDKLAALYSTRAEDKAFVSPKLNFIYNPNRNWQVFLKSGIGFHSNDTRVVVAQEGRAILPAAYGLDLGTAWKPLPRLWFNSALWYLFLEQEFVYVGDEGIVEPSGKTRRYGLELGMRWQLTDGLFFDSDVNYTIARAIDEPEGADYIPLAPDLTAAGGLVFQSPSGFSGGIRYRYIKSRPANEDGSITAKGYFVTDGNLNYTFRKATFSIIGENLLDTEWNEAQFATESRLRGEAESVEELHFTPGMPFFLRGKVTYRF
ncbi:MAG: TonB-dependent receptor plug domain-containing protein [Lewinellaceae bacterium]|nr:TonB-dependent receptor plug domain-containing protein [Phaeodactylibacter sp.]MCB9037616.1 TonB-dependent receptor plug domain-containing protein [Lewinellaceae bacterium]